MVYFCCAFNCSNKRVSGSGIHFFSFPLNNEIRCQKWVQAVQRKGFSPSKYSRLCSEHFIESDYKSKVGARNHILLKDDAVPSVFNISTVTPIKKPYVTLVPIMTISETAPSTSNTAVLTTTQTSNPSPLIKENAFNLCTPPKSSNSNNVLGEICVSDLPVIAKLLCTPRRVQRPLFTTPKIGKYSSPSGTPHNKSRGRPSIVSSTPIAMGLRKKIKVLQQKVRRLSTKVINLEGLLLNIKNKGLIADETQNLLLDEFQGVSKEIFMNQMTNKSKTPKRRRYSSITQ